MIDSATLVSAQSLLSRVTSSEKSSKNGFPVVSPHYRGFSLADGRFSEQLGLPRDSERSSGCLDPELRGTGLRTGV